MRASAYEFMGEELGGRPKSDAFYDDAGHVLYDRLADSGLFFRGMMQLRTVITRRRLAVMCSEEDPAKCHRYLLIARALADLGYDVSHIRKDGRTERQADVMQARLLSGGRTAVAQPPSLSRTGSASGRPVTRSNRALPPLLTHHRGDD